MVAERALQRGNVPLVVHTLLEVADVARRQRHQLHAAFDAPFGHDEVFRERGGLLGLVHAELDLVVGAGRLVDGTNVLAEHQCVADGAAILHRAPHARQLVEGDGGGAAGDLAALVTRHPVGMVADRSEPGAQTRLRRSCRRARRRNRMDRSCRRCSRPRAWRRRRRWFSDGRRRRRSPPTRNWRPCRAARRASPAWATGRCAPFHGSIAGRRSVRCRRRCAPSPPRDRGWRARYGRRTRNSGPIPG